MTCELFEDLGPGYALDALEPSDRARLESHLQDCPACAAELAELQQVVAQLALALPQQEPSPGLRQRVLAAAASDHERSSSTATHAPGALADPAPPATQATQGGKVQDPVQASRESGRHVRAVVVSKTSLKKPTRWGLGALAAAVAALIWAASLQAQLSAIQRELGETSAQLERTRSNYNAVIQVLASPGLNAHDLRPTEAAPNARSTVWIDRVSGEGMMMARDLPPLGENQTYQVWLNNDRGRVSSGFLRRYDNGVYYLILNAPGRLSDYQRLGVTREPLGGSPGPTGPRVLEGDL
jgi:anti-sigma-K factor RskA